jgi:hypothetical protein
MGAPIFHIAGAAMLFDIPLNACARILLSPGYYLVGLIAVGAGYGLWEMRRWAWYLFLVSQVLMVYENAIYVSSEAESHHKVFALLISILVQVIVIYRVALEMRVPYLFPKIRWWESNPNYRLSVPVTLTRKSGEVLIGDILDLSLAGCFVKIRNELMIDENLVIQFRIYSFDMNCTGRAVWLAASSVTHPKGIGIKFGALSKSQKRAFRSIGRRLRKISTLYRRSRYLIGQEEFLKQIKEIEGIDDLKTKSLP